MPRGIHGELRRGQSNSLYEPRGTLVEGARPRCPYSEVRGARSRLGPESGRERTGYPCVALTLCAFQVAAVQLFASAFGDKYPGVRLSVGLGGPRTRRVRGLTVVLTGLGYTVAFLHLGRIKQLSDRYQPDFVSEHLSWGSDGGRYLNDLLPLPYTEEAVNHLARRVSETQDYLQRRIMVENVSCYLQFSHSHLTEWEFVDAVADRADCDILLDVNNIYVNAHNHGFDGTEFLKGISANRVKEIHLAGHSVKEYDQGTIIIDTHDQAVCDEVWTLYAEAIRVYGEKPTLIEWDSSLPEPGSTS